MAKKPIALRCPSGISCIMDIHFFILWGNAKYGSPSTTNTSPKRQMRSFMFHPSDQYRYPDYLDRPLQSRDISEPAASWRRTLKSLFSVRSPFASAQVPSPSGQAGVGLRARSATSPRLRSLHLKILRYIRVADLPARLDLDIRPRRKVFQWAPYDGGWSPLRDRIQPAFHAFKNDPLHRRALQIREKA